MSDNMGICPVCGRPVAGAVFVPSAPPAPPAPKKSKAPVILCTISVLALLAAIVVVLLPKLLSDTNRGRAETLKKPQVEEKAQSYAQWEFDSNTGVLTIYGGENTEDYDAVYNAAPWSAYGSAIKSVVVEAGVLYIGDAAFEGLTGLTNVTLPASLETIGNRCFAGCTGLYTVYIPAGVTYIGEAAFRGCSSMVEYHVDGANTAYCSIAGALLSKDCTTFIQLPAANGAAEYIIPNTVSEIAPGAFYGCRRLTAVTIPGTVREIRELTFYGCSSMTKIVLPMSVRVIYPSAFTEKMNRASDGTPVIACTAMKKIVYDGLQEWFYSINFGADNDNLFNAALHFVDPWDMPQSTIDYFETYLR